MKTESQIIDQIENLKRNAKNFKAKGDYYHATQEITTALALIWVLQEH